MVLHHAIKQPLVSFVQRREPRMFFDVVRHPTQALDHALDLHALIEHRRRQQPAQVQPIAFVPREAHPFVILPRPQQFHPRHHLSRPRHHRTSRRRLTARVLELDLVPLAARRRAKRPRRPSRVLASRLARASRHRHRAAHRATSHRARHRPRDAVASRRHRRRVARRRAATRFR